MAKTNNHIKMGDTVIYTHAATSWYTVDQTYKVVPHPIEGHKSVVGSDGLYDLLSLVDSHFEKVAT